MTEHIGPMYEWDIEVRRLDHYGKQIVARTPTKVLAATKSEVTAKVRAMFEAEYDDFRKFWSHTWALNSVHEVQHPAAISDDFAYDASDAARRRVPPPPRKPPPLPNPVQGKTLRRRRERPPVLPDPVVPDR